MTVNEATVQGVRALVPLPNPIEDNRFKPEEQQQAHKALIAEMKVKGYGWDEISTTLNIRPAAAQALWRTVLKDWREARVKYADEWQDIELVKLEQVEAEYWRGYRASQVPLPVDITIDENGQLVTTEPTHIKSPGDPRFLDGVLKVMLERAKRLSLYPDLKKIGDLSESVRHVLEMPAGANNAGIIASLADEIELLGGATSTDD